MTQPLCTEDDINEVAHFFHTRHALIGAAELETKYLRVVAELRRLEKLEAEPRCEECGRENRNVCASCA